MYDLVVRDTELDGRRVDIGITGDRIASIGEGLAGRDRIDARGGAVIPGLADHHLHLFATAAAAASVKLEDATPAMLAQRLRDAAAGLAPGAWLRATGYHERSSGPLDRAALDAIIADRPVRVQHQTGAVWVLNSAALASVGPVPGGAEDGRLMRLDAWLRTRIEDTPPSLATLGAQLARYGITHVTDASVSTDAKATHLLEAAVRDGALPVQLMLMSGAALPVSEHYSVGPLKILLDDADLPPLDAIEAQIGAARAQGRAVAVHCVAAGELAMTLAAFAAAGVGPGDRIEHGGIIPEPAISVLRDFGLTVVTQSGFIHSRGERYLATVDAFEQPDLYRCASLLAAGVPVAGSSDAPYGPLDPWVAMRTAVERRTAAGRSIGPSERIDAARALALYLGDPQAPGGPIRRVAIGERADLCVLRAPLAVVLADLDAGQVRSTIAGGVPSYRAD